MSPVENNNFILHKVKRTLKAAKMGVEVVAARCPEWEGKYWRFDYESCAPNNLYLHTYNRCIDTERGKEKSTTLTDVLNALNSDGVFQYAALILTG